MFTVESFLRLSYLHLAAWSLLSPFGLQTDLGADGQHRIIRLRALWGASEAMHFK